MSLSWDSTLPRLTSVSCQCCLVNPAVSNCSNVCCVNRNGQGGANTSVKRMELLGQQHTCGYHRILMWATLPPSTSVLTTISCVSVGSTRAHCCGCTTPQNSKNEQWFGIWEGLVIFGPAFPTVECICVHGLPTPEVDGKCCQKQVHPSESQGKGRVSGGTNFT